VEIAITTPTGNVGREVVAKGWFLPPANTISDRSGVLGRKRRKKKSGGFTSHMGSESTTG
jgi:hypothetical protein